MTTPATDPFAISLQPFYAITLYIYSTAYSATGITFKQISCTAVSYAITLYIYSTAYSATGITFKQISCTAVSACRYILVRLKFLHKRYWSAPLFITLLLL